jgi:hypothetical protein
MRTLTRRTAAELLRKQGVTSEAEVKKVLSGFDFGKPIYEHDFWPEDILYQFIRRPSAVDPLPNTGNWFGLSGITTSQVAINEGLAGRSLVAFKVTTPFSALEGTAAHFKVDLGKAIGGEGGGTQIFVPKSLIFYLSAWRPRDSR